MMIREKYFTAKPMRSRAHCVKKCSMPWKRITSNTWSFLILDTQPWLYSEPSITYSPIMRISRYPIKSRKQNSWTCHMTRKTHLKSFSVQDAEEYEAHAYKKLIQQKISGCGVKSCIPNGLFFWRVKRMEAESPSIDQNVVEFSVVNCGRTPRILLGP